MEEELIKQIKINIDNISNENDIDLINDVKEAIDLLSDDDTKKELTNLLTEKFNKESEITTEEKNTTKEQFKEETVKETDKEVVDKETTKEPEIEQEKETIVTPKKASKKINVKLVILTGAMGLGLFGASFAIANRTKTNNDKDETISSSMEETESNIEEQIVENNSTNLEVSSENTNVESEIASSQIDEQTPIQQDPVEHSTDTTNASQETEDRINLLSQQMDAAGLDKSFVQTMSQDEKLKCTMEYGRNCYTKEERDLLSQYKLDPTALYNHIGCFILTINQATETSPIMDYLQSKGIDTTIVYQFERYESSKEIDYENIIQDMEPMNDYQDELQFDDSLRPMSEEQFERLEDLVVSIVNDYCNEVGVDGLYYLTEDSETIQQINTEKYGYTYVIQ